MKLIDVHAHLDQIENVDAILAEAVTAGVEAVVAVGVDLASSQKNLEIKRRTQTPKIYTAFGIHPGEIKPEEVDPALTFFAAHISEACAIGEIGLDFWYRWVRKNDAKKNEQREVYRRQLELAREQDLPVIIHSRGAWRECLDMLQTHGPRQGVFHWYSGPLDVLKDILDGGFFISATPSLAYSPQAREAVSFAPIEQMLIETDCPVFFKAGEGDPGFRSSPKDVFRTLEIYAALKNMEPTDAAKIFMNNFRRLFGRQELRKGTNA
jgi:TatD DNase family protein